MGHIEDPLNQHSNQPDQPDSSSEITMFTLIPPDGQQQGSNSSQGMKNDTNNNSNDRNNNKNKLDKVTNSSADDDGNNNHQKRHGIGSNGLQRYQLDNCNGESNANTSSLHPHHLLLLQQQQMGQNHMLLDKQSNNLVPVSDSPSLIVLQPSGQPGSPYAHFPYYAAGK